MNVEKARAPRVHDVDRLRTRVWFAQAMLLSSTLTPHSFWRSVLKSKTARCGWYDYRSGATVPRENRVRLVEEKVEGSERIFKALFWSALKGDQISLDEVSKEFDILTKGYSGRHKFLDIDFWKSPVEDNPDQLEYTSFQTIFEHRSGEDLLQIMVLIMSLAKEARNKNLWNYMCDLYRKLLPVFIPTIRWPFKADIFDELDKYVQSWVHSGVELEPDVKDWRNAKSNVRQYVEDEYDHILLMAFQKRDIYSSKIPENFISQIAAILAAEFCKSEDQMLYSWHLCDPISIDIVNTVADILHYGEGAITLERIVRYLNSQGYFNNLCPGYEAFAKFTHIQKYHLNFFH